MAPRENSEQQLKSFASLCHGIPFSKLWSGVAYGMEANIYRPTSITDMELNSQQCLLLVLLNSLVTRDVTSCLLLADICYKIEELRSRYYKVWLLDDFIFPQTDIQKAVAILGLLVAENILKLPLHVMGIMASLAKKYGVADVQLNISLEESLCELAIQLEKAVINNSPRDIIAIATEGGDVNWPNQSGDSPIHLAARTGKCASITALNFLKADLEAINSRNATPLMEAMKNNRVSSIKALLKAGAKVNKRFFRGDTYLHIAVAGGNNGALEVLLEAGMNVNAKNHFEETPLVQAVSAGNVRGMEILLDKGADGSIVPEGEKSLIEMVVESQNPDMIKSFVKRVANLKNKAGETIIHLIVRSGNVEMLKEIKNIKLLEKIKTESGLKPLHVASDPFVISMLIGMGADVNIKTGKGETALHLASAKGFIEMVKALVQHGAAVDSQDDRGTSALMLACATANKNIVTFLLYNGGNPNIKDKKGRTPLHYAAEGGCIGSVKALLDAGAILDDLDNEGDTPAFVAAINNKPGVLKLLVERGADLTLKNHKGDGILHLSARNGHIEVVKVLLDAGVVVDMKGYYFDMDYITNTFLHSTAQDGLA